MFNDEEAKVVTDEPRQPAVVAAPVSPSTQLDPSLSLIKDFPVIGDDGRSATFTWSQFYVDYQTAGPVNNDAAGTLIPAHVVGAKALGITDPAAGQRGAHRRVPDQGQGEAQADRRLLEHRLRHRPAADRPEPVPVERPVQGHRLRRSAAS